jgi:hypothetical protein
MKLLTIAWCLLSASLIALKLFTFEFFLKDEPTAGLALRKEPGLDNQRLLDDSSQLHDAVIITQSENDFLGGDTYRFLVGGGWLGIPLGAGALLVAKRLSRRRSSTSGGTQA